MLLAHFYNAGYRQHVTLAQVLWMQGRGVHKFFTVATRPLDVASHFTDFSGIRELKGRLRDLDVEVFDRFNRYSRRFHKLFGLRSTKAFDLFNQMVTIKAVGNLNRFVRMHMLEASDVQADIDALRQNFDNLTRCHEAIRHARRQRELLRPLVRDAAACEKQRLKVKTFAACIEAVPIYFARRKRAFLEEAAASVCSSRRSTTRCFAAMPTRRT